MDALTLTNFFQQLIGEQPSEKYYYANDRVPAQSLFTQRPRCPQRHTSNVYSGYQQSQDNVNENQFTKCLKDRLVHPNDCYQFEFDGIKCFLKSAHRFNWNGYVVLPSGHPDLQRVQEVAYLKNVYKVHNGLSYYNKNVIGFTGAGANDYCLLRETITKTNESQLKYKSFEFIKSQTKLLARQVAERNVNCADYTTILCSLFNMGNLQNTNNMQYSVPRQTTFGARNDISFSDMLRKMKEQTQPSDQKCDSRTFGNYYSEDIRNLYDQLKFGLEKQQVPKNQSEQNTRDFFSETIKNLHDQFKPVFEKQQCEHDAKVNYSEELGNLCEQLKSMGFTDVKIITPETNKNNTDSEVPKESCDFHSQVSPDLIQKLLSMITNKYSQNKTESNNSESSENSANSNTSEQKHDQCVIEDDDGDDLYYENDVVYGTTDSENSDPNSTECYSACNTECSHDSNTTESRSESGAPYFVNIKNQEMNDVDYYDLLSLERLIPGAINSLYNADSNEENFETDIQ